MSAGGLTIEAVGVSKIFLQGETEVHALRGVDLEVERGTFLAVMGRSGSGKSTLLHIIGALETPTAGRLAVSGVDYEGLDDNGLTAVRRDRIGFVFQFFNLLPTLTAEENVMLPALIAGERRARRAERARELLRLTGLEDRADHLPAQLSGGEQQRVSIARALLRDPELVLADEPTGNLDTVSGEAVLDLLAELQQREGRTVVTVTHDPAVASRAQRVVFLRDGLVAGEVEGGSPERIVEFLRDLESAVAAPDGGPAAG